MEEATLKTTRLPVPPEAASASGLNTPSQSSISTDISVTSLAPALQRASMDDDITAIPAETTHGTASGQTSDMRDDQLESDRALAELRPWKRIGKRRAGEKSREKNLRAALTRDSELTIT